MPPSHYVGIGASAGGLEALQEFFSHLSSETGAAFIVIQHLSPDFKSMMPELLSKHTSMPIYQVVDGMSLEPDCIYLMPPRKNMLIGEGKLLLSDQMPDAQLHMPIDIFLRSLAEDQQHRAIGIVLSGTGSDGTRGIKAMKESGGLVIVQEPGSAKFDGMPISAYNTGLADLLLPPREMGVNLEKFITHPSISGKDSSLKSTVSENDDTLAEIFQLLKRQSSINFSQYKASTVARRIERRLGINQLTSLDAYLRLLIDSPRELQTLSKELLIGVTRFFRDDEIFNRLRMNVIPKIVDKALAKNECIRLWIAGCSSGEEAYSLAILLSEYVEENQLDCGIKIFATDVDDEAIAEASTGVYSMDIELEISPDRLKKYFVRKEDGYIVTQKLRQMVIFAAHNLIEDPPFSNIDMISCRNVLIYFQQTAQKKVLSSLYFALQKEGYLFLGTSESLGDLQSHFETVDERSRIFVKVSNMRVPIGNAAPLKDSTQLGRSSMGMMPATSFLKPMRFTSRGYLDGVLERLVSEYAPDCIVISDSFEALHVYGDVSVYTKGVSPGKISNNIKDMVVDDLGVAISTALYRCEKNEEDVFYKDVLVTLIDGSQISIDLSIFYIKDSELTSAPRYYIVQFVKQEANNLSSKLPSKITFNANEQSRQRIRDLEQELVKKQEHLQVTIEELETTNEELQSANEELMSANEELQSTNEELQSVNEELYTVNSEYQEKIAQLTELNDDLDSVINATDIGIVFLDHQLTIRKFTPSAARYINLRMGDVGRPFHHISHELIYNDFLADIASVSATSQAIEKDVNSYQDHALLIRILPYRKANDKLQSGVLITITNISRQRFVESALQQAQEQLRHSLLNRSEKRQRQTAQELETRVLLLDDDSVDRKHVEKLLKAVDERDFHVDSYAEIDKAVQAVIKNNYDIGLVDYKLASHTARDFIKTIRELGINLPTVVLSGYSEEGLDSEFLNAEVCDFLNKNDLSSQLLMRSIDYVIERRGMQDVLDNLKQ
ncbi:MAG: chemotaxis protein CheB [Pseudomonadota bacterium]